MNVPKRGTEGIGAGAPGAGLAFWVLCVLLAAVFLLGGGARGDVQSLVLLRPLAILALGFGIGGLQLVQIGKHRFLCLMGLAIAVLPALHLIPLPPAMWSSLPGRSLASEIGKTAGLGEIWRPMSLVPEATWNAIYATSVPLAVLALGLQLDKARQARLLPAVLAMGAFSAVMGLLQILGDPAGPLYLYKITNSGTPVGLFANHNHQALLLACMLPMIAVFAVSKGGSARVIALIAALLLLPLILLTGSRAGIVAALVAALSIPFVLPRRRRDETRKTRAGSSFPVNRLAVAGIAAAAMGVVVLAVALGRGTAFNRLLSADLLWDSRVRIIPTVTSIIESAFPWGTGMGSFEKVYQVYEPDALLNPDYMNHAHNDWLELVLTGGLPALLLLGAAVVAFALRARRLFWGELAGSPSHTLARLGLVVVLLSAIASIIDYPLRVPSLGALFVLAAIWAGCPLKQTRSMGADNPNYG